MNNDKKGLLFRLKLIQATLFDANQQSNHFTLSIINKYTQYNTSSFPLVNKTLDLKSCSPITIDIDDSKYSFLKIILNDCQDNSSCETHIDYKIIEIIVNRGRKAQMHKKRHILAFPLFGRSRAIVGELRIKLSILQSNSKQQRLERTTNAKKVHRQLVFSTNEGDDYFQPIYSRFIQVKLDDKKQDSQQCMRDRRQKMEPEVLEKKNLTKNDAFEPFKEEISLIQLRDSNQGRSNQQEECDMVEFDPTSTPKQAKSQLESPEIAQQNADIPEDCRYLFQKINEINKRYAPLERIPSQEQFSDDYSELNREDNKAESDLSSEQISHPLQQVEELLKQLDLIKFAQTLQQSEAAKS